MNIFYIKQKLHIYNYNTAYYLFSDIRMNAREGLNILASSLNRISPQSPSKIKYSEKRRIDRLNVLGGVVRRRSICPLTIIRIKNSLPTYAQLSISEYLARTSCEETVKDMDYGHY